GGDRDAFLIFEPEVSGPHHITATSSKAGETGSYTVLITSLDLRGEDTAEDSAADGTAMRTSGEGGTPTLRLDQSVEGALAEGDPTLENGEFRDSWLFRASKGQSLHFEVSSTDFDTYMVLVDSEENVLQNDDLDGARDRSGIDWTAPSDGPVLVVVTSYRKGETGNYRLVATGGGAAGETASISGRVYGVFLGISDYPGTDNDLPLCDRDAVHLQRVLVEHAGMEPEDGLVLINREARIDAVRKAVRDVAGRMQDGDLFVFFYSGHGARVKRTELVPHDPDGHDALDEALVLYDEPLLDDDLDTLLASVDHGTVLVILDSCFSGGFSKDVISRPNRMGLFSSHEDVTSATAAKFKAGGYLAAFAAEAVSSESDIADENGDGLIDAAELSQYIYEGYRNELVRAKSSDYLDVGDNLGYQQLIVDRGGVGVKQPLFRVR
ncbi:MAG TPA: caspase family protein, partial [Planctomycetes bacterium]|nr:caspase family protein [Planctomycetota bacterium]